MIQMCEKHFDTKFTSKFLMSGKLLAIIDCYGFSH